MVLSAAVDFEGRLIDIDLGYPGSAHDARVFRNSQIAQLTQDHFGLPYRFMLIHGHGYPCQALPSW